ncbi:hypothetical protein [Haloarchaeobius sp. HME9146]|uniref:hypothetical protein n=1 Tax=Haloarchaeobius sp. HME9146 TaxID=2978732 RepID=UPI0021C0F284|nr:hypothetical protein [Haloarchaeobius sp. HME9146]MCT9096111.1 hypothetical protein [Haloarchaeobius sp. HME9146]
MRHTGTLSNTTTVSQDGITVEKGIAPGDKRMTVRYQVTSEREGPAAIRLVEPLGAEFPLESLNLDGAGHGDWLLEEGGSRVALVDIVDAGETVTTSYVVHSGDPTSVESVLEAPIIDMVDPVEPASARTQAGLADGDGQEPATDEQPVIAPVVDEETVVTALVDALDSGAVDADQLDTLRDHIAPAIARSDEVRFRHLQSRLEDFAAYADGLEALIDEHGTASDIVVELKADIGRVRDDLAAATDRLDEASAGHANVGARFDAAEAQLSTVASRLDTVEERLKTIDGRLTTVDDRLASVDDAIDRIDDRLDAMDARFETADGRFDQLDERLATMDGRLDDLATDLDAARSRVETVDDNLDESTAALSEDLDSMADRLDDLAADLAETEAWRDQLGEAFQGRLPEGTGGESSETPDGDDPAATE